MKTMLFKHIFMKIRQNYKRFLSLLFMALLGIGFYAGIEACSPDMLKTLDKFYDDNNVYDILIFSNLGLDDNDIDRLSNIDGVDKVIGSYEKDTYLKLNNEQYVIKVIGLNDNINKVYIEDGRLPNNNDEIVVEKKMIVDNNLSIGDSIDILGSNKKIVGTIISPLYFSTERPSTNLGSGKVDYYAYTLSDLLKSDYYSVVYLTVKDTMHMLTNSKEYQNTINNFVEKINVVKKDREEERYDELYTEIENYLYISSSYNTSIDVLTSANALELNSRTLNEISESTDRFTIILNNLYEPAADEVNEIVYTNNLFIGDSRIEEMKNYGIVDSSKVIYGRGYGYDWFIGNGEFNASNTNSLDGGINGAIKRMRSNTNYNIIIWLGINDLNYRTADVYFDEYYKLAKEEWDSYNVYIVKVGPVRDDLEVVTNDRINSFNERMQSLINNSNLGNLRFVDINYNISNYDDAGLHYGNSDYKKIYSDIMKYVGLNNSISREYQLYNLDDYCEFIYVDGENSSNGCEEMSISSTVLSRDEFITKLDTYYGNNASSYGSTFKENAGKIYDLATRNGINPELIVVRADIEGYSPVSQGFGTYYNYWGIGCYNNQPLSKCISYDTFDDGVLGFINNVSSYDSLSSMMKKYTYIGDYWYNPGDSGAGGCYFYPYIKKYMSASRANEIEPYCAKGNTCSGDECLKTNDEDQLAYSMYQVEIMASRRNSIFNITSDFCSGYSQNCTLFAQGDSRWKNIKLGNSNSTMGASGCAVTSIAIGISCSGTEIAVANFDAGKLINTLNEGACFTSSGAIMWGCSAIKKIAPNVSLYTTESLSSKSDSYKKDVINRYNTSDKFVLVHFENSAHPRGHYVVVTSINGNEIIAKDPAGGKVSNVNIKYVDQVVVYTAK